MKKTLALIAALILGCAAKTVFAQTNPTLTAPAVSIIDITNIIYPLPMPAGGGPVTFTYKVTNPGKVSLNNVSVADDYCSDMSGELGDINGNHLLDPDETWIYACPAVVIKTTTHSAVVTAYANGLETTDKEMATVEVPGTVATSTPDLPSSGPDPHIPTLPNNGPNPDTLNATVLIWEILGGILVILVVIYFAFTRKKK
jgi:hypothetical protein